MLRRNTAVAADAGDATAAVAAAAQGGLHFRCWCCCWLAVGKQMGQHGTHLPLPWRRSWAAACGAQETGAQHETLFKHIGPQHPSAATVSVVQTMEAVSACMTEGAG